jgi:hypothetical protein
MRTLLALLIIFCLFVYWVDSTEPKTKETETIKKKEQPIVIVFYIVGIIDGRTCKCKK